MKNITFPLWKPQKGSLMRFNSINRNTAYKAYRNSCSSFIANKNVRKIILEKSENKCVICGSKDRLQIDHITSVYTCFKNDNIYECNIETNLQALCNTCNASKKP